LRSLEYFSGILFLTTNRVGDFDEAFTSRTISLYYPTLDNTRTGEIFNLYLKLIFDRYQRDGRDITIDNAEIGEFVANSWMKNDQTKQLNGRQIRNACETALALAEFDAQGHSDEATKISNCMIHLKVTHLEVVYQKYLDFNRYLYEIFGTDANQRATESGLRANESRLRQTHNGEGEGIRVPVDEEGTKNPKLEKKARLRLAAQGKLAEQGQSQYQHLIPSGEYC
jgi:hypothetical protein